MGEKANNMNRVKICLWVWVVYECDYIGGTWILGDNVKNIHLPGKSMCVSASVIMGGNANNIQLGKSMWLYSMRMDPRRQC